ncbi:hypothetical protein HK105_209210 [Polyrhizophydium stewartii]|uniref:Uncharacterized protein n=1 Tax=Polyrhizophydium stewartii TaxID=2732419 RepID=A0ABR4MVM2_9FUNG
MIRSADAAASVEWRLVRFPASAMHSALDAAVRNSNSKIVRMLARNFGNVDWDLVRAENVARQVKATAQIRTLHRA